MEEKPLYRCVNDYILLMSELSAISHFQSYYGYYNNLEHIRLERKIKEVLEEISYKVFLGEDVSLELEKMGYIDNYWLYDILSRLNDIVKN